MTREGREVARVLNAAADLIEPEGAWTQGGYARDNFGGILADGRNPSAECWCLVGALEKASGALVGASLGDPVCRAISKVAGRRVSLVDWNDAPGRTQAEVVAALRTAASLQEDEVGRG